MQSPKHSLNLIIRDKHGRLTLFQKPNLPIIVWLVSWLAADVLPYGQANFAASLIAFGSLFTWAWLEVFEGDSYFRRGLGTIVLVAIIWNRL